MYNPTLDWCKSKGTFLSRKKKTNEEGINARAKNSVDRSLKKKCACAVRFLLQCSFLQREFAAIEDTFIALQFFNDVAKDDDEGEDIANAKDRT